MHVGYAANCYFFTDRDGNAALAYAAEHAATSGSLGALSLQPPFGSNVTGHVLVSAVDQAAQSPDGGLGCHDSLTKLPQPIMRLRAAPGTVLHAQTCVGASLHRSCARSVSDLMIPVRALV
jgi:hypothetical protein